ncbi:MAG TPA: type III pantothenate kinase [Rhodocyclaceae bacterium]|nr:type III pantothenate kinase [Rhodocyclaceae bacterium]
MILCIDSGNTRLKWGIHDGDAWQAHGALAKGDLLQLAGVLPRQGSLQRAIISNVAGENVADVLRVTLPVPRDAVQFVQAAAAAGGVRNGYRIPARLGVDRWCALIGARSLTPHPCIVVGAGTATTIDTLSADGAFQGGVILPGFDLMRAALSSNTAQLPLAEGRWHPFPKQTEDAIVSGCIEAQVGAIERAYRRIAANPAAECLLFGGAASRLQPHLSAPHRVVEHLVLEGLLRLATAEALPAKE